MKSLFALLILFSLNLYSQDTSIEVLLTKKQAKQFCDQWLPELVLGEKDPDDHIPKLMDNFYTQDIVLTDPNGVWSGSSQVQNYYHVVLGKYKHWSFKILEIYPTQKGFILHYEGHVPKKVEKFRGVDIIELKVVGENKYKISSLEGLFDRQPFIDAEKIPQQMNEKF